MAVQGSVMQAVWNAFFTTKAPLLLSMEDIMASALVNTVWFSFFRNELWKAAVFAVDEPQATFRYQVRDLIVDHSGFQPLPDTLEFLEYRNSRFDRLLPVLPSSIKKLKFKATSAFNRPLPSLPDGMEELILGGKFNQPIASLPASLITLRLGDSFNQSLPTLPCNLQYLHFGKNFNTKLPPLPASLTELYFGDCFNQPVEKLPPKLECLIFGRDYNFPMPEISESLVFLQFYGFYKQFDEQKLESWDIEFDENQNLTCMKPL